MKVNNLSEVSERFKTKVIDVMENEIQPYSFQTWIEPLKVVSFDNNIIRLYHDIDYDWVAYHYGDRIKELLNEGVDKQIEVVITNKVGSG